MEFHCVDLPQHGVVLVPPTDAEYDGLLADIRRRMEHPVAGSRPPLTEKPGISDEYRETSSILVNRGSRTIAELQQVWRFEQVDGRTGVSAIGGGGGSSSVLLPFGLDERSLKLYN
jgi:hypothetical protein